MPVNTLSVSAAVTPTVVHTYLSHYLNRSPLRQKPTAHISYHEGLELIRRFLHFASFHTVEELQAFTSQWVPVPRWVHVKKIEITSSQLERAAKYINAQLGPGGIKAVGGETWWQWRRDGTKLEAEWIEMRKDHDARKQLKIEKGDRIMLYVHGGGYFFGSVDEHRYQMQRHARKLKARVLAPEYRLAPQFPFPCGLHDCLASYLYLLEQKHDPSTIILAGDSAGGGMVLSMLVTIRDQGIPPPAGAILISPWVDLTHSFPSLGGDGKMDYIPAHGFIHKPSMSWPPPNADDLLAYETSSKLPTLLGTADANGTSKDKDTKESREARKEAKAERVRGYSVRSTDQIDATDLLNASNGESRPHAGVWVADDGKYSIGPKGMLSVQLEDEFRVEIKDQIQMYAPNHLLTHPLVSPALQPSLGGLPPLLIQTGGGELLRDEQIYVAHKAAHPLAYMPPPSNNQTLEEIASRAEKYKSTNVQLQVWDDLCHVCPTLSFTRPAKYMYRSIAQFGAWSLARAQKKTIDILDDDDISFVSSNSSSSDSDSDSDLEGDKTNGNGAQAAGVDSKRQVKVGKAGDPLPPFEKHMIRQRIDRHGRIYALPSKAELVACNLPRAEVGVPKTGPVSKWMKAQEQWNSKFAKQKIKIQKQRIKDMEKGFEGFNDEKPPPTALAGRRVKGMKPEKPKKRSWGMSMWSGWGSKHDQATIGREERADNVVDETTPPDDTTATQEGPASPASPRSPARGTADNGRNTKRSLSAFSKGRPRSHSRHSAVTDQGQTGASTEALAQIAPPATLGLAEATVIAPERKASPLPSPNSNITDGPTLLSPTIVISDDPQSPDTIIPASDTTRTRPTKGGIAYPFSLKVDGPEGKDPNASTLTLQSVGISTPPAVDEPYVDRQLGYEEPKTEAVTDHTLNERPGVERFYTAAPGATGTGAGLFSEGSAEKNQVDTEKVERPPVERFETALEDLNTVGGAQQKA